MAISQTPMYKRNIILKKGKASRTPGKTKGENCQTSPGKKFWACSPKAYKHKDYEKHHEAFKRLVMGGGKK